MRASSVSPKLLQKNRLVFTKCMLDVSYDDFFFLNFRMPMLVVSYERTSHTGDCGGGGLGEG